MTHLEESIIIMYKISFYISIKEAEKSHVIDICMVLFGLIFFLLEKLEVKQLADELSVTPADKDVICTGCV